MHKILIVCLGLFLTGAAFADDVAVVKERTDCAELKAQIDDLVASGDADAADTLAALQATYRTDCTKRASGRGARTIAATRGSSVKATEPIAEPVAEAAPEVVIAEKCDAPDANGCCPGEEFVDMGDAGLFCCVGDMCFPPMEPAAPEKTTEEIAAEIAANIAKGLCGDGTKPNKFGCCTGEKFTDLGNLVFACCPADGGDCYPPMN